MAALTSSDLARCKRPKMPAGAHSRLDAAADINLQHVLLPGWDESTMKHQAGMRKPEIRSVKLRIGRQALPRERQDRTVATKLRLLAPRRPRKLALSAFYFP